MPLKLERSDINELNDTTEPNLGCATIPVRSCISLIYLFGTVLDQEFVTRSAVQKERALRPAQTPPHRSPKTGTHLPAKLLGRQVLAINE